MRQASAVTAVLAGGVALSWVGSGLAATSSRSPVPVSFAGQATSICRDLKTTLDVPLPATVRRAADRIPGHATKAEVILFGTYVVTHELPAFRRAAFRAKALGMPRAGRAAWTQFLTGFQDWVFFEAKFDHQLQLGNDHDLGYYLTPRHRAALRVKAVAASTGATICASVIG